VNLNRAFRAPFLSPRPWRTRRRPGGFVQRSRRLPESTVVTSEFVLPKSMPMILVTGKCRHGPESASKLWLATR